MPTASQRKNERALAAADDRGGEAEGERDDQVLVAHGRILAPGGRRRPKAVQVSGSSPKGSPRRHRQTRQRLSPEPAACRHGDHTDIRCPARRPRRPQAPQAQEEGLARQALQVGRPRRWDGHPERLLGPPRPQAARRPSSRARPPASPQAAEAQLRREAFQVQGLQRPLRAPRGDPAAQPGRLRAQAGPGGGAGEEGAEGRRPLADPALGPGRPLGAGTGRRRRQPDRPRRRLGPRPPLVARPDDPLRPSPGRADGARLPRLVRDLQRRASRASSR